jgi:hypothetical protein
MLKMLGKLLKYDFKFYCRIMPVLYLVILGLSALAGLDKTGVFFIRDSRIFSPAERSSLLAVFWCFMTGAVLVVNIGLIIQRFRENLLRDPGYLMLTLPTSAPMLIGSKVIAGFCVSLLTVFFGLLSMGLMVFLGPWEEPGAAFFEYLADNRDVFITGAGCIPAVILHQLCLIYALMTASRMLPRFRSPAVLIGYFALTGLVEGPIVRNFFSLTEGISPAVIPVHLALGVLYFWLAGFLLKRTLNLE